MGSQIVDSSILQMYIKEGRVDYQKLHTDPWLKDNIAQIEDVDIDNYSHNEKFAFWLNAYNLITLKGVCQELQKNPNWQGNTSLFSKIRFFYLRKHKVAGKKISLYSLENKILRNEYKDPRIHFAINCASISCPFLPGKLFQPENLFEFLEDLTEQFINNQNSVILKEKILYVSRIFKWYKKDFKQHGGVISFIQKYWKGENFPEDIKLKYLEYDWHINSVS